MGTRGWDQIENKFRDYPTFNIVHFKGKKKSAAN
jgi:hypothetical protein